MINLLSWFDFNGGGGIKGIFLVLVQYSNTLTSPVKIN